MDGTVVKVVVVWASAAGPSGHDFVPSYLHFGVDPDHAWVQAVDQEEYVAGVLDHKQGQLVVVFCPEKEGTFSSVSCETSRP